MQNIKSRSPLKILKKKRDFACNPQHQKCCVQTVFFNFNPIFLVLTFQIIYQYPNNMTQPLKPLNLSAINLKDESFHNSIEWSGPYYQVNITPWLGIFFRFKVFRLLENALCETPSLLVWSDNYPPCRAITLQILPTKFPPMKNGVFLEKSPSLFSTVGVGAGRHHERVSQNKTESK